MGEADVVHAVQSSHGEDLSDEGGGMIDDDRSPPREFPSERQKTVQSRAVDERKAGGIQPDVARLLGGGADAFDELVDGCKVELALEPEGASLLGGLHAKRHHCFPLFHRADGIAVPLRRQYVTVHEGRSRRW